MGFYDFQASSIALHWLHPSTPPPPPESELVWISICDAIFSSQLCCLIEKEKLYLDCNFFWNVVFSRENFLEVDTLPSASHLIEAFQLAFSTRISTESTYLKFKTNRTIEITMHGFKEALVY